MRRASIASKSARILWGPEVMIFGSGSFGLGQFKPVEGGLACKGTAFIRFAATGEPEWIGLTNTSSHAGIAAETVMVVEILISHCDAANALTKQIGDAVFDKTLVAKIGEAF